MVARSAAVFQTPLLYGGGGHKHLIQGPSIGSPRGPNKGPLHRLRHDSQALFRHGPGRTPGARAGARPRSRGRAGTVPGNRAGAHAGAPFAALLVCFDKVSGACRSLPEGYEHAQYTTSRVLRQPCASSCTSDFRYLWGVRADQHCS
jgi:hypothetical protein